MPATTLAASAIPANSCKRSCEDLRARGKFPNPVTLTDLRGVKGLEKMVLLQKGSRLSVQPVTSGEWEIICRLGGVATK